MDNVQGGIARVETDISALKTDVSSLKSDVSSLKTDVSSLKSDVSSLKSDVSSLKTDVSSLKSDVSGLKSDMTEVKFIIVRMDERLNATLPHLATKAEVAEVKAELAEKPSKTYMWGVMAALLTAYACGLAALAVLR